MASSLATPLGTICLVDKLCLALEYLPHKIDRWGMGLSILG